MAWIEVHQELRNHPKTGRLARRLRIGKPQAIGHLVCLWFWATDYADDGELSDFDVEEIAEGAGWSDDPAAFVNALIYAGFIDADDAGDPVRVHDWTTYGGKLADRRKANAERQKRHREQAGALRNSDAAAPGTGRNANVTRTSPLRNGATEQDSTVPNQFANAHNARARATCEASPDFERFRAEYPAAGLGTPGKAEQAFATAVANDGADLVFAGLTAWKASGRWLRGYVTNAATWLADGMYKQPPPADPKPKAKTSSKPEKFVYPNQ